MNNTLQQVSGAIGSAVLITVMNNKTTAKAEEIAASAMNNMSANAQTSTQGAAELKQQIMNEAMLHGINYTFFISTLIAVIALILAFFIKRVKPNQENMMPHEDAEKQVEVK